MEPLRCCTLTGVDEQTNLTELARMSRAYPISEWGVLYSQARTQEEGGKGRYPRLGWIKDFAEMAQERQVRTALHLCGKSAIDFLHRDSDVWELASKFGRVQLNVRATGLKIDDVDEEKLERLFHEFHFSYGYGRIILQDTKSNRELCTHLGWKSKAVDFLVDGSGGRGISPESWPSLAEKRGRYGYAGGMGPDNCRSELERISLAHGDRSYWTDQEGKLRPVDDKFSLKDAGIVLHETSVFLVEKIIASGAKASVHENHGDSENEDYRDTPPPRHVEDLRGFWLDWYAGVSAGYAMMIPPERASKPMYLNRRSGEYGGYQPTEYPNDLSDALDGSEVGCIKEGGKWYGVTQNGDRIAGLDRNDAMLKGSIHEALGSDLPGNPGHLPAFVQHWVGPKVTEEVLPQLIAKSSAGIRP